jgi:NAD(P)H-dependent flavin oxidoreductase YrpB (nitropropane dioxygenase family)
MAIRISTGRLAGAVGAAGGVGVIAGTGMEPDELQREIRVAREHGGGGIVGVNIMYAVRRFSELVHAAFDAGIDVLISGAGFSRDMFGWGRAYGIPVVPIVGSGKLARMSEDLGADAVVAEGYDAGGHLGTKLLAMDLLREVRAATRLPVIAAGGMVDAADVSRAFDLGADGVQLGIRFAATVEANGHDRLKAYYVQARDEDQVIIDSPVGLPGRALRSPFSERLARGEAPPPVECIDCLKKCSRAFCIRDHLCLAQEGDIENGLIFTGGGVGRIDDILPAATVIERLMDDLRRGRGRQEGPGG